MSLVYDAGVLVAAEQSDRYVWADHRVRLELGLLPLTTAPVIGQVSRSPRQAQLRRFLRGCQVMLSRWRRVTTSARSPAHQEHPTL